MAGRFTTCHFGFKHIIKSLAGTGLQMEVIRDLTTMNFVLTYVLFTYSNIQYRKQTEVKQHWFLHHKKVNQ